MQWYRAGVEQDLRVTRLYEYFMNSLDPEEETEIPRSALIYFAYQSNLDQERLAFPVRLCAEAPGGVSGALSDLPGTDGALPAAAALPGKDQPEFWRSV